MSADLIETVTDIVQSVAILMLSWQLFRFKSRS